MKYNWMVGNPTNLKLIFIAACFTNLVYEALSMSVTSSLDLGDGIEDRSWWIPKRIPEYLTYKPMASSNDSASESTSVTSLPETVTSAPPVTVTLIPATTVTTPVPTPETPASLPETVTTTPSNINCTKKLNPSQPKPNRVYTDAIYFTKYQQPEPLNKDGIRFPATPPLLKNKYSNVIKPRYDNNDYVKHLLLRWMNKH